MAFGDPDYTDFDDGGGRPEDYGLTQSDFNTASAMGRIAGGTGTDADRQAVANFVAQPQVGLSRSNIPGMANYDPEFAAALKISRGLNPADSGITSVLRTPTYLQPQLLGDRLDARGEPVRYYSPLERVFQETLPPIIQGVQSVSPTGIITSLINRGLDVYEKGKELYDETFGDTILRRYNFDNEQKQKADREAKLNKAEKDFVQTFAPTPPPTQYDQFGNVVGSTTFDRFGLPTDTLDQIKARRDDIERAQQQSSLIGELLGEPQDRGIMQNIDPNRDSNFRRAVIAGFENANRRNLAPVNTQTAFNLRDFVTSPGTIAKGLQTVQPFLQQLAPDNVRVITDPFIDSGGEMSPQIKFEMDLQDLGLGGLFRNLG